MIDLQKMKPTYKLNSISSVTESAKDRAKPPTPICQTPYPSSPHFTTFFMGHPALIPTVQGIHLGSWLSFNCVHGNCVCELNAQPWLWQRKIQSKKRTLRRPKGLSFFCGATSVDPAHYSLAARKTGFYRAPGSRLSTRCTLDYTRFCLRLNPWAENIVPQPCPVPIS